jgi:hypothetical protein
MVFPQEPETMRVRRIGVWLWRAVALASLIPLALWVNLLIGPGADQPFDPLMGVDFGAFYTGATLVWDGQMRDVGNVDAQRTAQQTIQQRAATEWRWFNSLPHPPVVSLVDAPRAARTHPTAILFLVLAGVGAAGLAVWALAGTLCRGATIAATVVLFSLEPIWDVAWWGQIDSFLLLPVAAGTALLASGEGKRRDVVAGLLIGTLALKPILVPIPLLALLWGRRPAALGMVITGGVLAAISVAMVGLQGIRDYVHLSRSYQQFEGAPYVVEWRMYNIRGQIIRFQLGLSERTELYLVLTVSVILGLLTIMIAGRALRAGRSPDIALSVVMLAMLLTAYHLHIQTTVFLAIPLAVCLGRSLRGQTARQVALWAFPVVALLVGMALLRPDKPSPSAAHAHVESYLTLGCLGLLIALLFTLWTSSSTVE